MMGSNYSNCIVMHGMEAVKVGNKIPIYATQNPNTHFMFNYFKTNHTVGEIMWKYTVQPDRPHMTMWRMHSASWIPKATNTHSEYVILIAFRRQQ